MNIYLITLNNGSGHNEVDKAVIYAKSRKDAIEVFRSIEPSQDLEVTVADLGRTHNHKHPWADEKPGVILSSRLK